MINFSYLCKVIHADHKILREGSRDQTTQGPPDHVGVQFNPKSNGKELKGIKLRQE